MRAAIGKTPTLPAAQIAEPCPTGPDPLFSNQDQVEDAGARRLTERFTQAHSAPITSGQLLEDVGILADTPATGQILRDEYEYPADVDPATKSLLQEASKIFAETAEDGVATFVTSKDYKDWWLTADEDIQSSKSGIHFGHYKAAAYNEYLTSLHVAKLNLILSTGIPLERWTHGLTVLLDK